MELSIPFYVLSLPFAFVVMAFLPETRIQKDNDDHKGIFDGFKALKELRIIYTIFLSFAIFFLLYSVIIYTPFMLKNVVGYTAKEAGLILAFQGIAVILTVSRVKTLAIRHSRILIIATGLHFWIGIIIYVSCVFNCLSSSFNVVIRSRLWTCSNSN